MALNNSQYTFKTFRFMKKILLIIPLALLMSIQLTAQVAKTVNCTAGGLHTRLTRSDLETVTDLTITGSVDARDFVIMRDSMTSLASVDLSSCTIMAYTGTEGPEDYGVYPANAIPEFAFYYNPSSGSGKQSLKSFTFPSVITAISTNAFRGTGLLSVTIPSTVTSIGDASFSLCTKLTAINIPSSVTSIGRYAFSDCIGSNSINISAMLTSIGDFAFTNCSGLIQVDAGNPNYSSLEGVLYDKAKTKLITCPISKTGTLTIPSLVTTIGNTSFYGCTGLISVLIPTSVKTIEESAFMYCTGLYSVNIPSLVTTLGAGAFQFCTGLTSVTIPSSVTAIGGVAFYQCSKLTSIFANSITPVDLTSSASVFAGVNTTTCTLYVPTGSNSAYQAANQWQDFVNISNVVTNTTTLSREYIKLYPNPVKDNFTVSGLEGMASVTVSDLNGKTILAGQYGGNERINASSVPKGWYIVKVKDHTGVVVRKMIKE